MPSAVIGALRVDLNLGTAGWRSGLDAAARDAQGAAGKFKAVGGTITGIGAGLTAGITAPLLGIGIAAVKTAGNFEASMIKLKIATQGTAGELKAMSDLALKLGKDTIFSAGEAAGAMEELAKTGVSTKDILNGAAAAAVNLAAATGSQLEPAAHAVSDAMNQFHLTTKDLPTVIDQITGAVNQSKLNFDDYQLGIAQAGGVAGAVGVSFKDFNAVLAGTSSMFSSGSDAGTSFKTFLGSLNPKSKSAAAAIEKYGLSFYDAAGKMKPMAEIAENLRVKLAGLSDKAKADVLKDIFGQDAMRTAVGLMNLGAKGLDEISAKIAKTDAAAQSAERMKGLNAQLEQLGGTLETLAIKIGDTGLLSSATAIITAITDGLDKLTEFSPATAQIVVGAAAIAAAIGPIMLVLGPVISGIGSLIGLLSGAWAAATAAAAGGSVALLGVLAPFAPIVLGIAAAVAAGYAVWQNWSTISPILQGLWNTFQTTLGPPLMTILSAVWDIVKQLGEAIGRLAVGAANALGPAFLGLFKAAADIIGGAMKVIGNLLQAVIDLLNGNFSGAWSHVKEAVKAAASGILSAIGDLASGVLGSLGRMVSGIWNALIGELGRTWDALKKRIADAKQDFFSLYDAVVGHSYIPDMVDGIAEHMARLDAVMTKPVKSATGKAKDAFKQLRDDLKPILDELFPESRALVDLQRKLAVIDRAEKAGAKNGGLSADQAEEARNRLRMGNDYQEKRSASVADLLNPDAVKFPSISDAIKDVQISLPDLSKVAKKTTAETVESFAGMARDVVGSLRGMVQSFKSGDILGGISGILDIVTQVTGIIRGTSAPRQAVTITGGTPTYGGGRALGGPVVPGKRYKVGERGPEWLEVNQPGRVVPENGGAAARGNNYYFNGVMTSDEFWDEIKSRDDEASLRGAHGGAQMAMDRQASRRQRSLYG